MATVNRNVKDMEVPSFAYKDRYDSRVFVLSKDEEGKLHKKTIGYMTDSTEGHERMVPNQYFIEKYQNLYQQAYPETKIPFHEMSIGVYALTLGVATKTELYGILTENYGPVYTNSILDYAMFSILYRSSVTQIFEKTMLKSVLFSDKVHTDNWYSDFFSNKLNEDSHHQFRIKWIEHLKKNGLKNVWLAIDGSNNDCEARRSFLAEYGFPKSHNQNKTVVGYMYVVDASTGRPVTYFVYEGSVPDSQAFMKVSVFLKSFSLNIEGVILDRGFAVEPVFKEIERNHWKYAVMLPSDVKGHKTMLSEHGNEIRWKSAFALEDAALFGIRDRTTLFASHNRESDICLFFDGSGGSLRSIKLIKRIQSAKKKAEKAILNGNKTAIEKGLKKYISIEGEGSDRQVVINYDEWDNAMASNGYFSIAVSDGMTPDETNRVYSMRELSESQYSILKSQEGAYTTRVHSTEGIYSKFAVSFIASLIRFEIEDSCKRLELDTNPTIQGLEHVCLMYTSEGKYEAIRNLSSEQKKLFDEFCLAQDDLERLATEYNERNKKDHKEPNRLLPQTRTPVIRENSHKKGRTKKATELKTTSGEKNKGGRPKGRKDSKPRKPRSDKGKLRGKRGAN